jgi:hypothetical protein
MMLEDTVLQTCQNQNGAHNEHRGLVYTPKKRMNQTHPLNCLRAWPIKKSNTTQHRLARYLVAPYNLLNSARAQPNTPQAGHIGRETGLNELAQVAWKERRMCKEGMQRLNIMRMELKALH